MNNFPEFQANQPALQQLSAAKLNLVSGGQKSNQIQPGVGYRISQTPGGTTVSAIRKRPPVQKFPPLSGRLVYIDGEPNLYMEFGVVFARSNKTGDCVEEIEITDIPTYDEPLVVEIDDKISVKITVGGDGIATAAEIDKASEWPESLAPDLIGGDNVSGTPGDHYIRILEIIDDPDHPGITIIKQHTTGHIDHFQPTLSENAISSYATGLGGRILKAWNASAGRFDFRGIIKGKGQLTVNEIGDDVEVRGNLKKGKLTYTIGDASPVDIHSWVDGLNIDGADEEDPDVPVIGTAYNIPIPGAASHPWKVTDGGSGNAAVAAGYIYGYYLDGPSSITGGGVVDPPDKVVGAPAYAYAAGTVAVSGTKYIYAEVNRNGPTAANYYSASTIDITDEQIQLYMNDDVEPAGLTGIVTIVADNNDPGAYTPATGAAAYLIAKVTNAAGVITVDAQYLTHNPLLFIPVGTITAIN